MDPRAAFVSTALPSSTTLERIYSQIYLVVTWRSINDVVMEVLRIPPRVAICFYPLTA